jgi:hypothetical protein
MLQERVQEDREEGYSAYFKRMSSEFLAGIAYYIQKYELDSLIIGRAPISASEDLSICINADGKLTQTCPTCLESKTVNLDISLYNHIYEPNEIVRSLVVKIMQVDVDKRKSLEMYHSRLDEW